MPYFSIKKENQTKLIVVAMEIIYLKKHIYDYFSKNIAKNKTKEIQIDLSETCYFTVMMHNTVENNCHL